MKTLTRRECLATLGSVALFPGALQMTPPAPSPAGRKPMRGAFMILATPYTESKEVDYEDLAREVTFLDRCDVQGMVWPQNTSEYRFLKREERLRGMEVIARAAKGTRPALVLGVQAPNTEAMLEFARLAEQLQPDGVIAMPPTQAKSLNDYREYFRALGQVAKRPVFIQTTGGAPDIDPTVDFIVELAREFPNLGYVKEEYKPVVARMIAEGKHRPSPITSVFSGNSGLGWPYEMRLGFDGTMTGGAMYADVYAHIWRLHEQNKPDEVRDVFSKLLLMLNLDDRIPGTRRYLLKRRRICKTMVSRQADYTVTPEEIAEIEHNLQAIQPYMKASGQS